MTALAAAVALAWAGGSADAQLIPGIEEWAEQAAVESQAKWIGPRLPFPIPRARPRLSVTLRSALRPLALHVDAQVPERRAHAFLAALEAAYDILFVTGFSEGFGDAGQGDTLGHDFYLIEDASEAITLGIDATEPLREVDGVRAFAIIDARIPQANIAACAADALVQTYLYELDPAEAQGVRTSSAAYVTSLLTGSMGCADPGDQELADVSLAPDTGTRGADWLAALDGRQSGHTGTFLLQMWQFARQRTWEGAGLRASPDLLEAIAKAISLSREKFEDVAGELALERALALRTVWERGATSIDPALSVVPFEMLPKHVPPPSFVPGPLAATYALVRLGQPHPGETLKVWSRGEAGVRWSLQAMRLDRTGTVLSRVRAPTRDDPSRFLLIDLDANTHEVLVAVTNVSDGTPDPDTPRADDERSVMLILDH